MYMHIKLVFFHEYSEHEIHVLLPVLPLLCFAAYTCTIKTVKTFVLLTDRAGPARVLRVEASSPCRA